MNKKELEKILDYHNNLYYNQDNPEISDAEYDSLKNKYVELYGEYDYVPGEASSNSIKYEHRKPVLSLAKVQITDSEGLRKEIERLLPVAIQPKIDGITYCNYDDGIIATRGNGHIGEVISTNHINKINGVGKSFAKFIRGEIVMPKSEFNRINKERIKDGKEPFENARNAAAGMVRRKDASEVDGLVTVAYNCEIDKSIDVEEQMRLLSDNNWHTCETFYANTVDEALEIIHSITRDQFEYDIDGIVVKHNGTKEFGSTGHHPKNAISIKFAQEGAWTALKKIDIQVGRTGKITPVAYLEPIKIMGSTVSKATLHNFGIIKALGMNYTDTAIRVKVIKANDIIPAIVECKIEDKENAKMFDVDITSCPACGGSVKLINNQHFCRNIESCGAQLLGRIIALGSRDALDITGLSEATANKMIEYAKENGMTLDFTLPLKFALEDIKKLPGFGDKSAENLFNEIEKAKTSTPLNRYIYAALIPLIGKRASKSLADEFGNLESLAYEIIINGCERIKSMEDFGEAMVNSLKSHSDLLSDLWDAGVIPLDAIKQEIDSNRAKLTFVITGKFNISRSEIKKRIEEKGHKVTGKISKNTNYLVINDVNSTSSKAVDAKKLGVSLISDLEELYSIL